MYVLDLVAQKTPVLSRGAGQVCLKAGQAAENMSFIL